MDGVASIEGLRKRATRVRFGDATLLVESFDGICKGMERRTGHKEPITRKVRLADLKRAVNSPAAT